MIALMRFTPLCTTVLAMAGCALAGTAFARADQQVAPGEMIADRLHDRRIDIYSSQCRDFRGCSTFEISLDHNGRGEMRFERHGRPVSRGFIMTPYAFRKLQIILEPLRPSQGNISTDTAYDYDADRETSQVVWQSDHGTAQYFVRRARSLGSNDTDRALLKAENMLLAMVAPPYLGPDAR